MPKTISPAAAAHGATQNIQPRGLTRLHPRGRTDQVVDQLTDAILNGAFKAGEALPAERVLAATFGVSRNALREATKILASRGLLAIRHGVGTLVNPGRNEPVQRAFSHALHGQADALLQLMEVRLALETEIAMLAAQRATAADVERLSALLDRMACSLDDPEAYIDLDMEFHIALSAATHNCVFAVVLEATATLSREARIYSLATGTTTAEAQAGHRLIFDAIAAHGPELAASRMREHLKRVEADVLRGT